MIFSTLDDTHAIYNDVLGNVNECILGKFIYFVYLNIVIFVNLIKSLAVCIFKIRTNISIAVVTERHKSVVLCRINLWSLEAF
jgi:hypothetical protein